MVENKISATIPQADIDAVLTAIGTIREKLPCLIGLNDEQRDSLPRLKDKNKPFAESALSVATQNSSFLPRNFDVNELRKDLELYNQLSPIQKALSSVAQLVEDTAIEAGGEAYLAALIVYDSAKRADISTQGMDASMDEMARRFVRKTKPNTPKP